MIRRDVHVLKTWPDYFEHVLLGIKNFEVRKNDRNYMVGDMIVLREWDPSSEEFTTQQLCRIITYKLEGGQFGIEKGYCVLGLGNV